jgi:methylmalonyl-CoA mutase
MGTQSLSDPSLAFGFPAPDAEAWRALVAKTLKDRPFETLISKTYDGIAVQPLYAPAGASVLPETLRARAPFDGDRPWDIRVSVDHPDPAEANRLALAELEGGASSLLLRIDPAGETGVAMGSRADLEQTLAGVYLDLAPVALDAGFLGTAAAGWLVDYAETQTLKPRLHLHLDPLTAFARTGSSPGPIEAHLIDAGETARRIAAETAFLASGQVVHEAGGTEAQEVGFMAACGLAYAKAAAGAGLPVENALARIALGLSADADYFMTLAKMRAARIVWSKVAGAISPAPLPARIEARAGRRMLAKRDPWVNMLRLTAAAFGAATGGADAILIEPFNQPLGRATPFARRQARNSQLVLMEEAHIGRVADPAGGAGFIEALTEEIARKAWAFFQAIERRGGIAPALTSGFIAEAVGAARAARMADLEAKATKILGVTVFPNPNEADVAVDPVDPKPFAKPAPRIAKPGPDGACPPLTPWRAAEAFETSEAA